MGLLSCMCLAGAKSGQFYGPGSGATAISRDPKFGREFIIRRADRLLFGTDYLAINQSVPQFEVFDPLDLPPSVQAKVFRENAQNLIKA